MPAIDVVRLNQFMVSSHRLPNGARRQTTDARRGAKDCGEYRGPAGATEQVASLTKAGR
jgi:hypothetical protein